MDIKLLKKLREETGAGMLECKNALNTFNDDYDQALAHILKTVKKESTNDRVPSKGMTKIVIKDNEAILFEVNAETDFVVKNEHFVKMMDDIGKALIDSDVTNPKTALDVQVLDTDVKTYIERTSGIISEKAYLRRLYRVQKEPTQAFGTYTHGNGKLVTLVLLNNNEVEIANNIAMQVAAMNAEYLELDLIDQDTINYEKFMFEKQNGSFDEDQFNDLMASKTLLSQLYIKDSTKTVESYLKENQVKIIDFFKFELGQGIDNKLNCRLDLPCDGSKITVTPVYSK